MVFIHSILQKLRSALKNERGEANYFSTVVFIFIAVVLLAFIIDLFGIISTKQELDHAADQMVKQIQLSGGINSETDALFDFLCSEIEGADNITYSIDATYKSPTPSGMPPAMTFCFMIGTRTVEGGSFMGVLLIRELNVDGCGDFADVLVQTDQPVTPEQMKELHHELTRLNNEQECPDTDDVVEEAVKNTLGETARCIGYALLEYGGAGRHCDENFH